MFINDEINILVHISTNIIHKDFIIIFYTLIIIIIYQFLLMYESKVIKIFWAAPVGQKQKKKVFFRFVRHCISTVQLVSGNSAVADGALPKKRSRHSRLATVNFIIGAHFYVSRVCDACSLLLALNI